MTALSGIPLPSYSNKDPQPHGRSKNLKIGAKRNPELYVRSTKSYFNQEQTHVVALFD